MSVKHFRKMKVFKSLLIKLYSSLKKERNPQDSASIPLMRWAQRWLGQTVFYRQFVGGDTELELATTCFQVWCIYNRPKKD